MDVTRRQASGTLAELLGAGALAQRRRRPARSGCGGPPSAGCRCSPPRAGRRWRRTPRASTRGSGATRPPAQYAALQLTRIAPWTPVDSLVIGKAIAFNLSFDLDIDLTVDGADLPGRGRAGRFRRRGGVRRRPVPFAAVQRRLDGARRDRRRRAVRAGGRARRRPAARGRGAGARWPVGGGGADVRRRRCPTPRCGWRRDYQARAEKVPFLAQAVDRSFTLGSNEWAIAGRHTATGKPIVANDPHLSLDSPVDLLPGRAARRWARRAGRGLRRHAVRDPRARTSTSPGARPPTRWTSPTPTSSRSGPTRPRRAACPPSTRARSSTSSRSRRRSGSTPASRARPTRSSRRRPASGLPEQTLIVPRRNNGPIVSFDAAAGTALSVQYAGFSATRELDTFRLFDLAKDLDDFREALTFFDVGSQNWAYADVRGNIAYFTSAEMPLREDLRGRHGRRPAAVLPARRHRRQRVGRRSAIGSRVRRCPTRSCRRRRCRTWSTRAGLLRQRQQRSGGHDARQQPAQPGAPVGRHLLPQRRLRRLPRRADHRPGPRRDVGDRRGVTTDDVRGAAGRRDAAGRAVLHAVRDRGAVAGLGSSDDPALAALATDPRVVEAVGRLSPWNHTTPTGIREGYDASDVDGRLRDPSSAGGSAPAWRRPSTRCGAASTSAT